VPSHRLSVVLLSLLVTLSGFASRAGADWTVSMDRWFELTLDGKQCGSMHAFEERDGDRVRSTRLTQMRLARGETSVGISIDSVFLETDRGEPIECTLRQSLGGAPSETKATFQRDGKSWRIVITDSAGTREKSVADDGWLTPAAVERFVLERMKAGAREIKYRALEVESGLEISGYEMKRLGTGQAATDHDGTPRLVTVHLWTTVNSLQKLESTERYAQDGVLVESVTKLGFGEMKSRLTSKEKAIEASQKTGVEVMVRSFTPAKRRLFGVMELMSLKLKVTTNSGEISDFPSAGAQRVTRVGPNELRVEVRADRGSPASAEDATNPAYRGRSQLIDGGAPVVREILDAALPKGQTFPPRERAEQLRRATERALPNKNLASAFASASEAAKSRGGDCSEHAVLLAALLREADIPSRVAAGLVYADRFAGERNVWAWHVWTQALLPVVEGDGFEWVDFDATLPVRFHAAHLCVAVGGLEGGAVDPMWSSTLSLVGNLSILDIRDDVGGDQATPTATPKTPETVPAR
jgi:hypothetical protein